MIFKHDWERTSEERSLPLSLLHKMAAQLKPGQPVKEIEILRGGCSNLNAKIFFEGISTPFILRIYLHDPTAAWREKTLGSLLSSTIPIPEIYTIKHIPPYTFALVEWMPGISLREFLLKASSQEIEKVMTEVASLLTSIQSVHFKTSGHLDKHLHPTPFPEKDTFLNLIDRDLTSPTILSMFSEQERQQIKHYCHRHSSFFPQLDRCLVHGDFDPANILVHYQEDQWYVSGILDWEFAHAGTPLLDMANMLRYAHQMPPLFQNSFLKGLQEKGRILPKGWEISVRLLNISSVLDCLKRSDPARHPKRCQDCRQLLLYFSTL